MSMIKLLAPLFKEGWYLTPENVVTCDGLLPTPESPWSSSNLSFNCKKWHRIFFTLVSKETMVHSHCQQCFKVVVRPRTIEELNEVEMYQSSINREGKCGVEFRDFVPHLYGGYFYNRGLEAGRECYKEIKHWAESCWLSKTTWADDPTIYTEPMPVILKKGCTEFERAVGPSDKWHITPQQTHMEVEFDNTLAFDPFNQPQDPPLAKARTHEIWIDFAHCVGDMTYLKFMPDRKPITKPYVTYHERENENGEEN